MSASTYTTSMTAAIRCTLSHNEPCCCLLSHSFVGGSIEIARIHASFVGTFRLVVLSTRYPQAGETLNLVVFIALLAPSGAEACIVHIGRSNLILHVSLRLNLRLMLARFRFAQCTRFTQLKHVSRWHG